MSTQFYRRIDDRDEGRRRLRRSTTWTAAIGVVLSSIFGVALAHKDAAAAAPAPVTNDTGNPADVPSSDGGTVIQPPAQPPTPSQRHGRVISGGS